MTVRTLVQPRLTHFDRRCGSIRARICWPPQCHRVRGFVPSQRRPSAALRDRVDVPEVPDRTARTALLTLYSWEYVSARLDNGRDLEPQVVRLTLGPEEWVRRAGAVSRCSLLAAGATFAQEGARPPGHLVVRRRRARVSARVRQLRAAGAEISRLDRDAWARRRTVRGNRGPVHATTGALQAYRVCCGADAPEKEATRDAGWAAELLASVSHLLAQRPPPDRAWGKCVRLLADTAPLLKHFERC